MPARAVVAHQGRLSGDIGHQHVDIAIVVVVAKGRAATDPFQRQSTAVFCVFFKAAVASVEKELIALRESRILVLLDIAFQVAIGDKKIAVAVVIDIEKARTPR